MRLRGLARFFAAAMHPPARDSARASNGSSRSAIGLARALLFPASKIAHARETAQSTASAGFRQKAPSRSAGSRLLRASIFSCQRAHYKLLGLWRHSHLNSRAFAVVRVFQNRLLAKFARRAGSRLPEGPGLASKSLDADTSRLRVLRNRFEAQPESNYNVRHNLTIYDSDLIITS